MILRPVDEFGDILPVLSSSVLLRGAPAVAHLVEERLNLFAGEWWENPSRGNEVISMMKDSRLTEADAQALASYLTSYIRETPGVEEVRDTAFSAEGRRFSYACTVAAEAGEAIISFQFPGGTV